MGQRKTYIKSADDRLFDEKGALKLQGPQIMFANDRDLTGIEFMAAKKDEPTPQMQPADPPATDVKK